jgi:glutamyl endopeptidase
MSQSGGHLPISNKIQSVKEPSGNTNFESFGQVPEPSIIDKASVFIKRLTSTTTVNDRPSTILDESLPHIDTILPKEEVACGDNPINEVDAKTYPYRMICLLVVTDSNGHKFRATGFFISPRCIITAGHCIYFNESWAKEIEVIPGVKGTERPPYGSQKSSWFETTNGWIESRREENDYGVIFLPSNDLHTRIERCHFGYRVVQDNQSALKLTISGYPENKAAVQWEGRGSILTFAPNKLTYKIDTEKGNSGSPVFINVDNSYYALGVHNYGACPNFCTRITHDVKNNFDRWIQISTNPSI